MSLSPAGGAEGKEGMAKQSIHEALKGRQGIEVQNRLSCASVPCWPKERPSWSWRWYSGYALLPCSRNCARDCLKSLGRLYPLRPKARLRLTTGIL